ncbi:Alpha-(1-_3)-arabinofuranosyltransferase [Corynebacterium ciconiae DSM 44920]|uniref:glycosyltransferase family 87 protein n=1 Tax=Corynebacterium ciconiae TaxID=227319 RepID=UPI000380EBE4|nr:glycosyltransferase family 87 protein [Corynebacterium ciconiae]WKD61355.1 Alpha-(1->3)-arabinofuranosyltransferase [Corynebacterium ciconiae DSM 44920]
MIAPNSLKHRGHVIALWPIAVLIVAYRVAIRAAAGAPTDDFSTVYFAIRRHLDGVPVYSEDYSTVDPHYLYNPGATLILSPLGWSTDWSTARMLFICANALAIIAAIVLLFRLTGRSCRTPWLPLAIALAFCTESVINTLLFSNINGLLLLALVGFYVLTHASKPWMAGLILGLAIVIKPLFAPLIFIPVVLVRSHWPSLIGAIGVPVVANAIAMRVVTGAEEYFTVVVPYLGQVRDYANASLRGLTLYFGVHPALAMALWLLLAAFVGAGVLALLAIRNSNRIVWLLTTGSLLLVGVFMLSSLGQMYYSILLLPLVATAGLHRSVLHNPLSILALFLFYFHFRTDDLGVSLWGYLVGTTIGFTGWVLLIVVIGSTAVSWLVWEPNRAAAVAGRLGDPTFSPTPRRGKDQPVPATT